MNNGYGQQGDYEGNKLMTAREAHARGIPVLGAAGAMQAQTERPTPMMEITMRTLAERIAQLENVVNQAENRFAAVVAPEPPQPERANGPDTGRFPSSSLAGNISQASQHIEALTERLQSLVNRCEL